MKKDGTIRLSRAFCSARDRNVPVLRRERADASSDELPQFVSCLDYGVRCTGWLCPLFTLPPPGGAVGPSRPSANGRRRTWPRAAPSSSAP